ncbi:MAG: hypothetical protein Q8K71_18590 [Polaromonas sp.]|nr:hypothetical protein [Polaromonas sp.]MDP3751043.1 hypothetical protein [Polaromonas sp.]
MSMLKDVFDIGTKLLTAAASIDKRQKLEVAQHFQNLANVYMEFPPAHKINDVVQVAFLLAKTRSLLQSIEGSALFEHVLGNTVSERFYKAAGKVLNEKEILSRKPFTDADYTAIANAAGFLEGYAESLRAQAGDS